jgi:hypothetical protein
MKCINLDNKYAREHAVMARQQVKGRRRHNVVSGIISASSGPTAINAHMLTYHVWTTSKKQIANEATLLLLKLWKKYDKEFTDDHAVKNMLWAKIAQELNEQGYFVGVGMGGR